MTNFWKLLLIVAAFVLVFATPAPAKAEAPEAIVSVTINLAYDFDHDGLYEGIGHGRIVKVIREGIVAAEATTNSQSNVVVKLTIGNFYSATANFVAGQKAWRCDYIFEVTNSDQVVNATCFERSIVDVYIPFLSNYWPFGS